MFEFSTDKYRNKRAKKNKPRLDFSQRVRSIFEACLKCCLCYDVVLIFFDGFIYTRIDEIVC